MGKLSNMMYMIDLLNTGNIYTIKALSEKLGVTERMIRYNKNEICENGIVIESFKGPNGEYYIDLSILVNHAFQDGYHIGMLINILQENILKTDYNLYTRRNVYAKTNRKY